MVIGTAAREGGEGLHLSGKNIESTFLSLERSAHCGFLRISLCSVHANVCLCVCVCERERERERERE